MQLLEIQNNESKVPIPICKYYGFLKLYYDKYGTQLFEVAKANDEFPLGKVLL
ncbi:hypothetical protein LEP1GSC132_0860 [Leptospira kirschneri str. 200803703]|nr:hypothetical protein LEP1GSC044_3480 [Leptospira kirschneri serovar Grippotyphosa str. RM52]EKQ85200.1 hypothetical protein LEP1GSC064_1671 [Leptospira kirschneri serovar Grippotyphosa str. Moskva]EMN25044.1 hypothetical protein LEP1GSC065_2055 [Leptospira kirschneri serovar Sokoine str. RM1]EMO66340.1 hypothetical protein LEP1GSC132_0860 [Leptospira kirschneri str. 200803703]EMO75458.1 hypothetical protein LEP1GSC127_1942 [Leptospira kirschneri str. 200801925]EMO82139.1 hypothetical protei